MMSKFMAFFTTNLLWKVTALLMAAVLWFLAENIENPMDYRPYNATLEIRNLNALDEYDLVLLNKDRIEQRTVVIGVWANTRILNSITDEDIKAYIDMSPVFSFSDKILEPLPVRIEVDIPNYEDGSARFSVPSPSTQDIELDRLETREYPVSVVKTQDVAEGYVSMEPTAEPATLSVRGPSSSLDTIQSVRLDVALDGIYTDYFTTETPVIYDINNSDITESLEIIGGGAVNVTIPVNKHAMIPVPLPVITGYTLEGYTITSVTPDIEDIDVVGKEEEIAAVSQIILEPIDVTGASQTVTFTRDVRDFLRNTQLSVRNGTPFEVNITIVIEPEITKSFSVPLTNIDVTGNHPNAEIADDLVITLTGVSDIVDNLQESDIRGSIDLEGLEPGEHDVPVTFSFPSGVTLTGEPATIRVTIPEEEEVPEETEQEEEPTDGNAGETGVDENPEGEDGQIGN